MLLVIGLVSGLSGTWTGIVSLTALYSVFLLLTYRISGNLQCYASRRTSRTEFVDSEDTGHRFADIGVTHDDAFSGNTYDPFKDDTYDSFNEDSSHTDPAFNIDGAMMMGDVDTNGHVFGQTD